MNKAFNIITNFKYHLKANWIAYLPMLILFLVSFRQIYLHNYNYLNRWKGGGFGMFSKIENRFFHIHLLKKGALECAKTPLYYMKDLSRSSKYPSYLSLERLTGKLANNIWIYTEFDPKSKQATSVEMIPPNKSLNADSKIAQFDTLELQIYKSVFNRNSFTLDPVLIRKMQVQK